MFERFELLVEGCRPQVQGLGSGFRSFCGVRISDQGFSVLGCDTGCTVQGPVVLFVVQDRASIQPTQQEKGTVS